MNESQFCTPSIPFFGDFVCFFRNLEAAHKPDEIDGCKPGVEYRVGSRNLSPAEICAYALTHHNSAGKQYEVEDSRKCRVYTFPLPFKILGVDTLTFDDVLCQKYRRVIEGKRGQEKKG